MGRDTAHLKGRPLPKPRKRVLKRFAQWSGQGPSFTTTMS